MKKKRNVSERGLMKQTVFLNNGRGVGEVIIGNVRVIDGAVLSVFGSSSSDSKKEPNAKVRILGGISVRGNSVVSIFGPVHRTVETAKEVQDTKTEKKKVKCPKKKDAVHDVECRGEDQVSCCCLCQVNVACCVIMPCMHKTLCVRCSTRLCRENGKKKKLIGEVQCPTCRANVKKVARVFE